MQIYVDVLHKWVITSKGEYYSSGGNESKVKTYAIATGGHGVYSIGSQPVKDKNSNPVPHAGYHSSSYPCFQRPFTHSTIVLPIGVLYRLLLPMQVYPLID